MTPNDPATTSARELSDEIGVLGEALGQDRAGALRGGGSIGYPHVGVDKGSRHHLRIARRIAQQPIGERLEAGLLGDLRLGAALGLVRQVDVLEPRLRLGRHDLVAQLVVELSLGCDRLKDRRAPILQFTNVTQPFLEGAQLGVVERAGRFLAVPSDEWHGGAAIEQLDRRSDLPFTHAQLVGDPRMNGCVHRTD